MNSLLLYNPSAGRRRERRAQVAEQCASALRMRGFAVTVQATTARQSAAAQSREAVRQGAQAIFACGGDGTVHDVLQGIAGTDAALGILPAGSANALARELRLSADPVRAALSYAPHHVRVVPTMLVAREGLPLLYSLCMAGAGPDGTLMYRMLTVNRSRIGRWHYYEQALRLYLSRAFPPFAVQMELEDGTLVRRNAVSLMTLRVSDLSGVFGGIARGASLSAETLHIVLVSPPAKLTLPFWFLAAWLGLERFHPGVTIAKAIQVRICERAPLQSTASGLTLLRQRSHCAARCSQS